MSITFIVLISIGILMALVLLAVETIREFGKMDRKPDDFTGSDRLAGSAE
jgi:hypothetical protein